VNSQLCKAQHQQQQQQQQQKGGEGQCSKTMHELGAKNNKNKTNQPTTNNQQRAE